MYNSAQEIQDLVGTSPTYERILRNAKINCLSAMGFRDDPARIAGWGHNFGCPDCTARLIFDPEYTSESPRVYTCSLCGKEVAGQEYDEAWTYYYRMYHAECAESFALAALAGDDDAKAHMADYLDFYAAHYHEFPIETRWAGKGSVMGQDLDDAVWCIAILRGLYPMRSLYTPYQMRHWYEGLFYPLAQFLLPHADHIHNIPMWMRCAVGMIGITFGDDALLEAALEGPFGIRDQAAKGFTEDGIWYEGSMHYHFYALEGLTYFLMLYADKNPDDPLFMRMRRMYRVPMELSADGYSIPCINDGWYPRTLLDYAPQIARAAMITDDPVIGDMVGRIYLKRMQSGGCQPDGSPDDPLEQAYAMLMRPPVRAAHDGTGSSREPQLWYASKLGILYDPMKMILKSGVLTPTHMHRDCLSLVVPGISDDLGTPGYGHPLTDSWYRLPVSHNTVTVDEKQPAHVIPTHVEPAMLCDKQVGVTAVIDGGWDGVISASRSLMQVNGLKDIIERTSIRCEKVSQIDWIFHLDGTTPMPGGTQIDSLGTENGYGHFTDIRKIGGDRVVFENDKISLTVTAGCAKFYIAHSPDNPADRKRVSLIVRVTANHADFCVFYHSKAKPEDDE